MRCSCPVCGTYMVHAESHYLGCVCPGCGARCRNCLGTDSVIQKGDLSRLALWQNEEALEDADELRPRSRREILREADLEANGK